MRNGANISAPKNSSLLSNPKTSLLGLSLLGLLVFHNPNSCLLTASRCISFKLKRLVQFDPLQKMAFSVLLSLLSLLGLLVFHNPNSCLLTASRCISFKLKRLVQFDPLQKMAFSVLLSSVVSK